MGRVPGPGREPMQDWARLLAEYNADYEPHMLTLKQFVAERCPDANYKTVSEAFGRERKRAKLETFHARNEPILLAAQRRVAEAINDPAIFESPGGAKLAEYALKVFEKVAEREEPNPLLTQNLLVAPAPLFPTSALAQEAMEILMGKKPMQTVEAKVVQSGEAE